MPKYLFKGLSAVSSPGPGSPLIFPSPRSFDDVVAQISRSGDLIDTYGVAIEITLNGVDWRAVSVSGSTTPIGNVADGSLVQLGSIGMMIGMRLNLISMTSEGTPSLTILLAIDEKE